MEQKLPIVAKKFWKMVQVFYFMLRKGFSKAKLLANLNSMLRRGKIAGKAAIHGLLPHHAATAAPSGRHELSFPTPLDEYEFSCSNSPAYPNFLLPFHLNKRKRAANVPLQCNEGDLFAQAMEMVSSQSQLASPALSGFGRTPMARQLRITDSPFPVAAAEVGEDAQRVDEAAEKFILKFYRELRQQN